MEPRPSWDRYFMRFALLAATRASCVRRKVGAVIVFDKQVIATGYNGPPRGLPECTQEMCLRNMHKIPSGERIEVCRGTHAEANAIIQAARTGVITKGGALYCTHRPCLTCAKMIINAGIVDVVYRESYPDLLTEQFFQQALIVYRELGDEDGN